MSSISKNRLYPAVWGALLFLLAGLALSGCVSTDDDPGGGYSMGYSPPTSVSDREWK